MGLFRLEALDISGLHRLIDAHLTGDDLQITLQRLDAVSLLWRMRLVGTDVGARFVELLKTWKPDETEAGYYAFNDLHYVLALLGAEEIVQAERWVALCAQRAMRAEDARRSNHRMTRDVGLPLMRGLLASAQGDHAQATQLLYKARAESQRLGGSHAQRDLIDQTLLHASAQTPHRTVGRALLNERLLAKPVTPLTRHWAEQLQVPLA